MTAPDAGRWLIRQGMIAPIVALLVPIFWALGLPDYDSVSQHISEVALLDHPIAITQRTAAFVAGASIALFGLGLLVSGGRKLAFTSIAAAVFGCAMMSNGVFVMGSPLHGLYGLGLFMVLVPAFFAAEAGPGIRPNGMTARLSLAVALFNLVYMWLLISGLEPEEVRGLTQRVATVVIFGWYTVAGWALVGRRTPADASPSVSAEE